MREEFADYDDYDNGIALANMENGTCATIHVGKAAAPLCLVLNSRFALLPACGMNPCAVTRFIV